MEWCVFCDPGGYIFSRQHESHLLHARSLRLCSLRSDAQHRLFGTCRSLRITRCSALRCRLVSVVY